MRDLLKKYDIPVPRYTSYPTVPYWEQAPNEEQWISDMAHSLRDLKSGFSIYMHVPYCETLCTFCGCNNIITKDHGRESHYVDLLLKEFEIYLKKLSLLQDRELKHIHLGGGTPTFLSAEELKRLLKPVLSSLKTSSQFEGSIEVDPRRTKFEQLEVLRSLGFNRISLGVQDFDPEVQRLVNRIQPFEVTKRITDESRGLGFDSVNFDLIYGLAKQTAHSIKESALRTVELRPDRIALYSFALVPWIKPQQRLFKDEDLPKASEKRELYEIAREVLLSHGYVEIGMDHFALKGENLHKAQVEGKMHRNFMGYTDQYSELLLGLGVSSISESQNTFHQNEKLFPKYEQMILQGKIPTHRGHILSEEDKKRRKQILKLMTQYQVEFESEDQVLQAKEFLQELEKDNLVKFEGNSLRVTEVGRPFLRNACVFFDERLKKKSPNTKIFSQSI